MKMEVVNLFSQASLSFLVPPIQAFAEHYEIFVGLLRNDVKLWTGAKVLGERIN